MSNQETAVKIVRKNMGAETLHLSLECLAEKAGCDMDVLESIINNDSALLNPATLNIMAGKKPEVDKCLSQIISALTGWDAEKAVCSPLQRGDLAWSAGYLLVTPYGQIVFLKVKDKKTGKYLIDNPNLKENGKLISESGVLGLPAGFNVRRGYQQVASHAKNKLEQTMGFLDHFGGVDFGPEIRTEYPDDGPLGDYAHPNRWAFTKVAYISEEGVEALNAADVYLMSHAEFIHELTLLNCGKISLLSRLPQQANEFVEIFPMSFFDWNMNGARFSYSSSALF